METEKQDIDDTEQQRNSKFRFFYFNTKDKRLFPPKRDESMGWTINFGNPFAILIILCVITAAYFFFAWLKQIS